VGSLAFARPSFCNLYYIILYYIILYYHVNVYFRKITEEMCMKQILKIKVF
jgi:hypothetical protein